MSVVFQLIFYNPGWNLILKLKLEFRANYNREEKDSSQFITNTWYYNSRRISKKLLVSTTVNFVNPLNENTAAKLIGKEIKTPKNSYKTENYLIIKCPYCNNYNRKEDKSLILHIYNHTCPINLKGAI